MSDQGQSGQRKRPSASRSAASAADRKRQPPEATDTEPSLHKALGDLGDEMGRAFNDLCVTNANKEHEARATFWYEAQLAEFDQRKADGEAHLELMEALREASDSKDAESLAFAKCQEFERGVHERQLERQKRAAEAEQTYQETVNAAQEEFREAMRATHEAQIARLKDLWAGVDPESVDPDALALLGHLTNVAASTPVPESPKGAAVSA